jgi:hypothetical protein
MAENTAVAKVQQNPGTALAISDPSAIAAAEASRARIESAYSVALRKPRDIDEARLRILEACRRPMFAARVEYAKPTGGKAIKGPSIRFAELAVREWGNLMVETSVVYEDRDIRRVNVRCIDLQTNSTFSRDIQVKKTVERKNAKDRDVISSRQNSYNETVYIVRATDDEMQNEESKAVSKVVRNEGLRLIPADITDEALEVARETLAKKDAEDPQAARKRVIDAFAAIGVRSVDLAAYLGHPVAQLVPAELDTLRALHRAIADGETTWKAIMDEIKGKEAEGDGSDVGKDQGKRISDKIKGKSAPAEKTAEAPSEASAATTVTDEEQAIIDALYNVGAELGYQAAAMDAKIDTAQAKGLPALKSLLASWNELNKATAKK